MLCADNAFEPEDTSTQNTESALANLDILRKNCTLVAFSVRDKFKEYFISEVSRAHGNLIQFVKEETHNFISYYNIHY